MPTDAEERSPLLADAAEDENNAHDAAPTESSPLLASRRESDAQDNSTPSPSGKKKRRWPSFIAIIFLGAIVIAVMVLGFVIPPAVQKYIESAVVIEPTSLSVESLTADGVRARIQANFRLDGNRVTDEHARRIGRFATSVMRQLGAETTTVRIRLPGYDDALLGTAVVPPVTLDLVDGHVTDLDFIADVTPGNSTVMRTIVNDWLDGKLDRLKVTGATALRLKSGIFPLGTHDVVESMVFEGQSLYKTFAALYFGQKTLK